jgi:leucine dehydrogenase
MALFSHPEFDAHEEVHFRHDPASGLKAIIAIHDTTLGPALGGCRMWAYEDDEAALTDMLRLARGMSYKAAMADLALGGGKSVILADPRKDKSPELFRAMGAFVDSLAGRYVVAEDVGIAVADIGIMAEATRHVAGTAQGVGDPSPATAYGVYRGLRAALAHRLGCDDIAGLTVAVQGVGHVGYHLSRLLAADQAKLVVTDIHGDSVARVVNEFGAKAVAPEEIYGVEAEVFAPCALGAVIDDETVPRLSVAVVAGSANNQLAEARHGTALKARGILYAPDYVVNAGGLIHISYEGPGYDKARARTHVGAIAETLRDIFRHAERTGVATSEAADAMAKARLAQARERRSAAA